mgnify:CR=1 FL=1
MSSLVRPIFILPLIIAIVAGIAPLFFTVVNAKTEGFKERFSYPTPQLIKTRGEFAKYVDYHFLNSLKTQFIQNDNKKNAKQITNFSFRSMKYAISL